MEQDRFVLWLSEKFKIQIDHNLDTTDLICKLNCKFKEPLAKTILYSKHNDKDRVFEFECEYISNPKNQYSKLKKFITKTNSAVFIPMNSDINNIAIFIKNFISPYFWDDGNYLDYLNKDIYKNEIKECSEIYALINAIYTIKG